VVRGGVRRWWSVVGERFGGRRGGAAGEAGAGREGWVGRLVGDEVWGGMKVGI